MQVRKKDVSEKIPAAFCRLLRLASSPVARFYPTARWAVRHRENCERKGRENA